MARNHWIELPQDKGNWFDLGCLVNHLTESGQKYLIQGQWHGPLIRHPKDRSLDYWIRHNIAVAKDRAQATNDVVTRICSTGLFKFVPTLLCPNSSRLCKGIILLDHDGMTSE